MKKLITLFIALTLGLSACGDSSNVTNDDPNNNPPIGDEQTDDPREFLKVLEQQQEAIEITISFSDYVKNTWQLSVIDINKPNDEQIIDNFQVTFGENGEVPFEFMQKIVGCKSHVYSQEYIDENFGSCGEYVSNAPIDELEWSCSGFSSGFDLDYYYETKELNFDTFINIYMTRTFYPLCCGQEEGACEQGGFDPVPTEKVDIFEMPLSGANDQGFAIKIANLYYVFML